MNYDQVMNLVKQVLTLVSGIFVAKGVIDANSAASIVTNLSVAVPALIGAGSVVWSVYSHWGMKKVPDAATAVELPKGVAVPPVGASLALTPLTGTAKVVG